MARPGSTAHVWWTELTICWQVREQFLKGKLQRCHRGKEGRALDRQNMGCQYQVHKEQGGDESQDDIESVQRLGFGLLVVTEENGYEAR